MENKSVEGVDIPVVKPKYRKLVNFLFVFTIIFAAVIFVFYGIPAFFIFLGVILALFGGYADNSQEILSKIPFFNETGIFILKTMNYLWIPILAIFVAALVLMIIMKDKTKGDKGKLIFTLIASGIGLAYMLRLFIA